MTVKELEAILCAVKNKEMKVFMKSYYTQEANGYFFTKQDDQDVFMLTNDNVQPRIAPEL